MRKSNQKVEIIIDLSLNEAEICVTGNCVIQ